MATINKTFWNHYILHPAESKTKKQCVGNLIASIALGVLSLGIVHLVVYLKGRVSSQKPQTPEVGRADRVGHRALRQEPELPIPAMDEYNPSPIHLEKVEKYWQEIPANPGEPIPVLAFAEHNKKKSPAEQMEVFMGEFREKINKFFEHFEKARAVVAEFSNRMPPTTKEEREITDQAFMDPYARMGVLEGQIRMDGMAVYQIARDNPALDFSAECKEVQEQWLRLKHQTACYYEAFSWLNQKGFIRQV